MPHISYQPICIRATVLPVKELALVGQEYRSRHDADAKLPCGLTPRAHQQVEMDDLDRITRLFRDPIHDGFRYGASRSHGSKELDNGKRIFFNMDLQICKGIDPFG